MFKLRWEGARLITTSGLKIRTINVVFSVFRTSTYAVMTFKESLLYFALYSSHFAFVRLDRQISRKKFGLLPIIGTATRATLPQPIINAFFICPHYPLLE